MGNENSGNPNPKGQWAPGKSANPGGLTHEERARIAGVKEEARKHTAKAIKTLVDNMDDPDGNIRNKAAVSLLDRAWGKPAQAVSVDATADALSMLRAFLVGEPPEGG